MIRKYSTVDKPKAMELFRQNTPQYFDFAEEKYFENYLDNEVEDYFVYEQNSEIVGAGGINYFPNEKSARISWDMIDPKSHGKGIGRELTQYRIEYLRNKKDLKIIIVRTSQVAYKFYEKMGFELEKIEPEFWSKNFDLYQMRMINK